MEQGDSFLPLWGPAACQLSLEYHPWFLTLDLVGLLCVQPAVSSHSACGSPQRNSAPSQENEHHFLYAAEEDPDFLTCYSFLRCSYVWAACHRSRVRIRGCFVGVCSLFVVWVLGIEPGLWDSAADAFTLTPPPP